ncbi:MULTISPECIES: hypothetical protein [unclassified Pseudomonas]|uniref:hypothetical protein n=1 Tax=unclassified Pseudomonas TaxID=196821 RepID=UPI001AE793E7|nr:MULTISPECIES: hypothetical protein [unclassified Pseudomonas]MBP2272716.1 hypothetical protein [Pseudomonas sp. BP6]MBP2288313.1 hypothetical protein [Pseudomonas sp. BP7]HDS1699016.1 hypothetical protein [Pseudomonas putida]HDS1704150.1 hypothetical protein [Pseudomonas putida]
MIDVEELKKLYKQYGFDEAKSDEPGIHVFTYRAGHFHNADIVSIDNRGDEERVFNQFKKSGYACKTRHYTSNHDIEKTLFRGFFSADTTRKKLRKEYNRYTDAIAKTHSDTGTYQYINSHYTINDKPGTKSVVTEIHSRLRSAKPALFLIEAAAGFGKTCTAYELLKTIIDTSEDMVPLFSELSRNRQAKIFRYVFLDEIDRSFPMLRSSLVRSEIRNGNVPVILDGFDELLPQSKTHEEGDAYEHTEPMLETISELLTKSAKVILTTRRTAIFDGDNFHAWVEQHCDDFEIFRIRINEPTIEDWISTSRLESLNGANFPIDRVSNPVLLAYLRCISNSEFDHVIANPNSIVDKYFNSMLERERLRQDLRVLPSHQYSILKTIANDMINNNYTSESKEYISALILKSHQDLLDESRKQYQVDERPTLGELVTKLAGHAMLDRSNENGQGIGFVNEFVLGNFCAEIIIDDTSLEWAGPERFIEPSVIASLARANDTKTQLWKALAFSLEFLTPTEKVTYTISLTDQLDVELVGGSVESIEIRNVRLGKNKLENFIFIGCSFVDTIFVCKKMDRVSFINCRFFNCGLEQSDHTETIHALGCSSDNEDFLLALQHRSTEEIIVEKKFPEAEIFVLEKFWPKGRNTFHKHRPIRIVCSNAGQIPQTDILEAISALRRQKFIQDGEKSSILELNIEYIPEIKTMLGRN